LITLNLIVTNLLYRFISIHEFGVYLSDTSLSIIII